MHLHLHNVAALEAWSERLNRMPHSFDLFVSVPFAADGAAISKFLREKIAAADIVVERVPDRGRDMAPFIVQFGSRLASYDLVGHFHTDSASGDECSSKWRSEMLESLLGSGERSDHLPHIFRLLRSEAKLVYADGQTCSIDSIHDKSGWSATLTVARDLLKAHTSLSIEDFPEVEFPEGSMFWARADCIADLLRLPLTYDDFAQEPIADGGTLVEALRRLPLVIASPHPGTCIRLQRRDSIKDYRFYEEQEDFRSRLVHNDVRVLSHYLPQFHPIEENDRWHGEGFTEWTKVRTANPLFVGHYQQHIPHSDLGYYSLTSPDILRKQAGMMRKACVSGQVFYHYWFSGKLILERPARMLLENADIDMPFCFCWANENWTRKWDGNEDDVLLRQSYSAQDARAFIDYLIPFFLDRRYIRIDDRPVLFVYRPSAIAGVSDYLTIWAEACQAAGLSAPYVVAVLTRGASDPRPYGMDAGVERPLHDWTAGQVPDISADLVQYQPLTGASVLPYADVASFYRSQPQEKQFTYFRSLVPNWDNSARYGKAGYLLHGSTPELFQHWMENSIRDAEHTLPADRRLVVVNAWNEWAEGAHLEPDARYGYSYLNAIGRALSDAPYSEGLNRSGAIPESESVLVRLSDAFAAELQSNPDRCESFRRCLAASSIAPRLCAERENASLLGLQEFSAGAPATFAVEFRSAVLFDRDALKKLVALGHAAKTSVILANAYGQSENLIEITGNGSTHSWSAYDAPIVLFPRDIGPEGFRNIRVRTDAYCFFSNRVAGPDAPDVTTIVRYHRNDDPAILQRALFCLAAMQGCHVVPLIAAQDLSAGQVAALVSMVSEIPWGRGVEPRVRHYTSENDGDLRSTMLNQSIREVRTRYAAFLDYDDLLMPHAYQWLLQRLRVSGKSIAIGRVFQSLYDPTSEMLVARNRHLQYGYSFDDFVAVNIAPLHSFMLDLSQLKISEVKFFADQRYLEDYFLLLQLVTRANTDWQGLAEDRYIGDYIRFIDNRNTLAVADRKQGESVRASDEYELCEQRIRDLKKSLKL